MHEFPETSESLIAQVRNPADREAWEQFEQLYRPVIFRIARSRGLQHSDALDLVQQVLMSVSAAIGRYQHQDSKTPFRHWLGKITRNAILKKLTRGPLDKAHGGTSMIGSMQAVAATGDEISDMIETEYRREIYARAAAKVRSEIEDTTWLAFEMTMLQAKSVEATARVLGLSTGSVYAARSRVVRRLQDSVQELEASDGQGWKHKENKHD